jgi:hypothetical protein
VFNGAASERNHDDLRTGSEQEKTIRGNLTVLPTAVAARPGKRPTVDLDSSCIPAMTE